MGAIAFAEFRRRAGQVIEQVCDTDEPVTVTRADGKNVVIVSASEWASISETLHLMSSSENEQRLNHAAAEIVAEIACRAG
jgi:antitoxin YefM